VARRVAGGRPGSAGLRQAGAWLSVLAIAAFIATVMSLVRRRSACDGRRAAAWASPHPRRLAREP
jgi:hypothetical protein